LLEAASVLGTEFTRGSLAAGLVLHPSVIEDRCDELARQGQFLSAAPLFVRPDSTQVARYRFTHSLYPHAIAERVPAASPKSGSGSTRARAPLWRAGRSDGELARLALEKG
jgi:hypothetical protein